MKAFVQKTALLISLIHLCIICLSQEFESIPKAFTAYNNAEIREKVFVHTDKPVYVAGENIWFKAYQVDAATNKRLGLSKVLYVEVLSANKKPVAQIKVISDDGEADGSIPLPTTVETGNYILRAYTSWMKNFSADYFFEKQLSIVNTFKRPDWQNLEKLNERHLKVFPEGGTLVAGVENNIAFKLTDAQGLGTMGIGALVNAKGDTISVFQTYKFGMGLFQFVPKEGEKYKVFFSTAGSKSISKDLPTIQEDGIVMQLQRKNDNIHFAVSAKNVEDQQLYLLAHTAQRINFAKTITLRNGTAGFEINPSTIKEGISVFTLFDEKKQPVCERLFFKPPSKNLSLQIVSNKNVFTRRDKASLQVASKTNDTTENATVSMSVFKLDSLQSFEKETITSYLWLSSDLPGYIEDPGYYFSNPQDTLAADLLMMTAGWRQFNWKSVLAGEKPFFNYKPEYEGHLITGTVTNKIGQPLQKTTIFFSVPDSNFLFNHAQTDELGRVEVVLKDVYTGQNILVQTQGAQPFNINLLSPFSKNFSSRELPQFRLSKSVYNDLLQAHKSMQIQNIYHSGTSAGLRDSINTFYNEPNKIYRLDEYTRFPTMEEVLREFVTEIRLRGTKEKPNLTVLNSPFKTFFESQPLTLVDGVPVFNSGKVLNLDPLKIKSIDIISGKYHHGSLINNGIINFRSYAGDMAAMELDPNAIILEYEGLQEKRIFQSPVYDTDVQRRSRVPDFRTLLHWDANIKLTGGSNQEVEFYTSDVTGKYVILLQGLSRDGHTGSSYIIIDVKK